MHYLLFYDVVDDYVARREPYRTQHLAMVRQAHARGDLLMAGALVDPVDGAVLVFNAREPALAFVEADPYVQNGLVTSWRLRDWNTVVGGNS